MASNQMTKSTLELRDTTRCDGQHLDGFHCVPSRSSSRLSGTSAFPQAVIQIGVQYPGIGWRRLASWKQPIEEMRGATDGPHCGRTSCQDTTPARRSERTKAQSTADTGVRRQRDSSSSSESTT